MATNFGPKIAITGFVRTIATRQLVMVVGQQNADITDTLPWQLFLSFYMWVYIGATW